jgi:hypothetical protein
MRLIIWQVAGVNLCLIARSPRHDLDGLTASKTCFGFLITNLTYCLFGSDAMESKIMIFDSACHYHFDFYHYRLFLLLGNVGKKINRATG